MFLDTPRFVLPSFRAFLIKTHTDLLNIHHHTKCYFQFKGELSLLEELVLVLEDRRFFNHLGVDWRSVARECLRKITFRKHGGASTVDMQLVRTITGYKERTFKRKMYEMYLALLLQFRYSKIVVLRTYLSQAFFGSGLIGAEKAALNIFNKHPNMLSLDEAAFIAALLVYPKPISPSDKWELKVLRRAHYGQRIYLSRE